MPLTVSIVTQERSVLERDDVQRLIVPTSEGQITVLPGHAPLMAGLAGSRRPVVDAAQPRPTSEMIAVVPGEEIAIAIHGGFMQVANDYVTVLADAAEHVDEIDEARAEAARERAERRIAGPRTGAEAADLLRAQLALQRALLRLRVRRRRSAAGAPSAR